MKKEKNKTKLFPSRDYKGMLTDGQGAYYPMEENNKTCGLCDMGVSSCICEEKDNIPHETEKRSNEDRVPQEVSKKPNVVLTPAEPEFSLSEKIHLGNARTYLAVKRKLKEFLDELFILDIENMTKKGFDEFITISSKKHFGDKLI